jgi:hypothetical protein
VSTRPSIKGRIFGPAVEDAAKLLAEGAVSAEKLPRWLEPAEIALLGSEIQPTEWYDIRSYARILDLLRDVAGEGRNDYLRQRGARSAERLLEAGLYQQLEYLKRTEVRRAKGAEERYRAFGHDLRLLSTISSSILNFSRWEPKPHPVHGDRYVIEISDAAHFPDNLGWTSEGFVNRMGSLHGEPDLWRWKRVRTDFILLEMTRAL